MIRLIFLFAALMIFSCNTMDYKTQSENLYLPDDIELEPPRTAEPPPPPSWSLEQNESSSMLSGPKGDKGPKGDRGPKSSGLLAYNKPQPKPKNPETEETKPTKPIKKDTKKIIKTANMMMEVEAYAETRKELDEIIKKHDAYIVSEGAESSTFNRKNKLVVRMEPVNFDAFIDDIVKLALNVDRKDIQARDVTKEFVDMETRLDVKRRIAVRYRDILTQAKTIKDILLVEERLRTVTEEIERVEGQLKYMRDQVNYRTVNVSFYETLEQGRVAKKGFFRRIAQAFGNGWDGLLEFLIGMVMAWPFWIGVLGVSWLGRRLWRRRKK